MNRFFDFSPAQLRVIIFLSGLFLVLSAVSIIRSYSTEEKGGFNFTVQVGDNDTRYSPVFVVDLNLSPADSLELIPGIGPVLASRIVAYRDSVGRFEKPDDIIKVSGIGHKKYEDIKPYITVRPW